MAVIKDKTLSGPISIDGETYLNVVFENARLLYAGGQPPSFDNCSFNQATFQFEGAAGNTLSFLKGMAGPNTNMRNVVTGLISELND